MILMDVKGDKIEAVVKSYDLDKWKSKLKEDSTYILQNFEVQINYGHYRKCDHPFNLIFMKGTTPKEQDLPEIPQNVYSFKKFEDIHSGNLCSDLLVEFYELGRPQPDTKRKKVVFTMKDLSGNILSCTLWEEYASKFQSFHQSHRPGPMVIILTLVKIKEPEVHESYSQRLSQMSSYSQVSSQDKFLHKADVMSLSKVNGLMQDGELDPMAFPESIDDILELTLAFKIKVQPSYNRSSYVLMASQDGQLIGSILNQFSPDEETCTLDKEKSVCSMLKEDVLHDTETCTIDKEKSLCSVVKEDVLHDTSLSVTADHDPDLLGCLTPAKRISPDMQFDDIPTQDLASTQLSSTKLAKHIKKE